MMSFNERPVSRLARRRQLPGGAQRDFNAEYNRHNSNDRNNRSTSRRPTGSGGDTARPWRRRAADNCNTILLVHGLEHLTVNCDQVFNLFCLYGNVSIVKILKDKQALVELENIEAAKRCVANLHLLPLGDGRKLKVKYSKYSYIYEHGKIHRLQDGTPAFKVYSTSRLNRFQSTRTRLEKLRPAAPSKILHFYNAPTDICGVKLQKAVTDVVGSTDAVKSIVILPVKQGNRCSTGLIEMKTIDMAAKVITRLNHVAFSSTKSRFPFLVKLCFSKWSEITQNSSALLLGTTSAPHKPWLRHGSEQSVFTSEFPVSRRTRVAGGDNHHAWMLWSLSGDTAEIITASADPTAANRPRPAGHQQAGRDAEDASSGTRPDGGSEDRGDAAV